MQAVPVAVPGGTPLAEGTVVAALDLGSNSFHLAVARVCGGDLDVLERAKDKVQLAAGLQPDGSLDNAAIERGLASVARMAERVRALDRQHLHVVGTSALRQASNREAFTGPAAELLGVPVQVISGEEEAALIFLGVANMVADDGERLVIDIGGGSTEFAVGTGFSPGSSLSVPVGCVTLGRRWFTGDGDMGPRMDQALAQVRKQLAGVRPQLGTWQDVLSTSGSAESIHDVLEANGWADRGITLAGLRRIREELAGRRLGVDPGLAGLVPERYDIFPASVVILEAAMLELGLEELAYSEGTLQDGMLFQALGVDQRANVRDRSVERMQRRFEVDRQQAERVGRLAGHLLAQVAAELNLTDPRAEVLLQWAADLHEVGLAVAPSHHERHGAYLVQNATLRGFRALMKQALALLVRCHRRGLPTMAFAAFDAEDARRLRWLAVLLRLAVLLCRTRLDEPVDGFTLVRTGAGLALTVPRGWAEAHPLGMQELAREQQVLAGAGIEVALAEGAAPKGA